MPTGVLPDFLVLLAVQLEVLAVGLEPNGVDRFPESRDRILDDCLLARGQIVHVAKAGCHHVAKFTVAELVGVRSCQEVASRMFEALASADINIQMISMSKIKISMVISDIYMELRCARCTGRLGGMPLLNHDPFW